MQKLDVVEIFSNWGCCCYYAVPSYSMSTQVFPKIFLMAVFLVSAWRPKLSSMDPFKTLMFSRRTTTLYILSMSLYCSSSFLSTLNSLNTSWSRVSRRKTTTDTKLFTQSLTTLFDVLFNMDFTSRSHMQDTHSCCCFTWFTHMMRHPLSKHFYRHSL